MINPRDLLKMLQDAYAEEIEHIKLRLIRDAQEPRFLALKDIHPEIWKDFTEARQGPHEVLHKIRQKRIKMLTAILESGGKDAAL